MGWGAPHIPQFHILPEKTLDCFSFPNIDEFYSPFCVQKCNITLKSYECYFILRNPAKHFSGGCVTLTLTVVGLLWGIHRSRSRSFMFFIEDS